MVQFAGRVTKNRVRSRFNPFFLWEKNSSSGQSGIFWIGSGSVKKFLSILLCLLPSRVYNIES